MLALALHLLHHRRGGGPAAGGGASGGGPAPPAASSAEEGHPHRQAIAALLGQPPPLFVPGAPPASVDSCPWALVESEEDVAALAAFLARQRRFALDVEHHKVHSYAGVTCLLQLSTGGCWWRQMGDVCM